MFEPPEHNHNLSMMLSEVLQDIGVTETLVMKRRRMWMIIEALENTEQLLLNRKSTRYIFGSQSEASTTIGLKSDIDYLLYRHDDNVIQDLSQWQPDKRQFLMVLDETVSPGYCLLQLLRQDAPLPVYDIQTEHHSTDSRGRVMLRHSFCVSHVEGLEGLQIHGPAQSSSTPGSYDMDLVRALYCPSWPKEAIPWLQQQNISCWPTERMKRDSASQGCFVVPVGSKEGLYQDLEWRISTSLAERCLMYNLNMTQIRCYILMKMILKTVLKPVCSEAVSSYMCKNILFYCIAGSEVNSTWNEGSLLTRLIQCLQALLQCIQTENCPHFVIPRNNLLAGKLSAEVKRQLVDVLFTITGNIEQSLLGIQIDDLGQRLRDKLGGTSTVYLRSADHNAFITAQQLVLRVTSHLLNNITNIRSKLLLHAHIFPKLYQLNREGSDMEKVAVSLLEPFLLTTIGSIKASEDFQHSQNISPDALKCVSLGVNSDVSSSMLKLASTLYYCAGDIEGCEMILATVSEILSHTTVQSACYCYSDPDTVSADFGKLCFEKNEDAIRHNMAFCVTYMQNEINCTPGELKYELFRCTKEDRPYRKPFLDDWMDCAVIDSKPYLYFLQYKVYSQLQRPADQHRAIVNLAKSIETDQTLGHRETALNLLGQCMEQENWLKLALYCYKKSLTVRGRNNAAKWHVCRLLACLVRSLPK